MGRWAILSVGSALVLGLAAFAGSSSASRRAVPTNQQPPSVAGAALEGGVLTASRGRWSGGSRTSFAFQWRRCLADGTACADVPGATDSIYAVRTDDVGHTLRVAVTATNRDGSASAASSQTGAVAAQAVQAPHAVTQPTISGSPIVGRVLTAVPGTWTGAGGIRFSYRWRLCSPAGGDCADTSGRGQAYKPSQDDRGHTLRVLLTARNSSGLAFALSDATSQVAKPPSPPSPQNSAPPRIAGAAQVGGQLVGVRGNWTNTPSSFGYSWLRCDRAGGACGAIAGAHASAYSLLGADVG